MLAIDVTFDLERKRVRDVVSSIAPYDPLEAEHIADTLEWIDSGAEIFRVAKPATPPKHLVVYFVIWDEIEQKLLLVDHKKAQLWVPGGGHVEPGEHPEEAVKRELYEEFGCEAKIQGNGPLFITSTITVGLTPGHVDVSLWYVIKGSCKRELNYDPEEFNSICWFHLKDIPYSQSDPHMKRFINKLQHV